MTNKKEKYVRICPICGSTDVSPDFSIPAAVAAGALYMYRCNRCDYVGVLFPEVLVDELPEPEDIKRIKKDYPVMNITYGRGIFALLKYLAPLGFVFSLAMYFTYGQPYGILGVVVYSYLILYAYCRRFRENKILKAAGVGVVFLYVLFCPRFL